MIWGQGRNIWLKVEGFSYKCGLEWAFANVLQMKFSLPLNSCLSCFDWDNVCFMMPFNRRPFPIFCVFFGNLFVFLTFFDLYSYYSFKFEGKAISFRFIWDFGWSSISSTTPRTSVERVRDMRYTWPSWKSHACWDASDSCRDFSWGWSRYLEHAFNIWIHLVG